jgi:hypothetical protein
MITTSSSPTVVVQWKIPFNSDIDSSFQWLNLVGIVFCFPTLLYFHRPPVCRKSNITFVKIRGFTDSLHGVQDLVASFGLLPIESDFLVTCMASRRANHYLWRDANAIDYLKYHTNLQFLHLVSFTESMSFSVVVFQNRRHVSEYFMILMLSWFAVAHENTTASRIQ